MEPHPVGRFPREQAECRRRDGKGAASPDLQAVGEHLHGSEVLHRRDLVGDPVAAHDFLAADFSKDTTAQGTLEIAQIHIGGGENRVSAPDLPLRCVRLVFPIQFRIAVPRGIDERTRLSALDRIRVATTRCCALAHVRVGLSSASARPRLRLA